MRIIKPPKKRNYNRNYKTKPIVKAPIVVKKVTRNDISLDPIIAQPINFGCHNPKAFEIMQKIQLLKNQIMQLESLL